MTEPRIKSKSQTRGCEDHKYLRKNPPQESNTNWRRRNSEVKCRGRGRWGRHTQVKHIRANQSGRNQREGEPKTEERKKPLIDQNMTRKQSRDLTNLVSHDKFPFLLLVSLLTI